MNTKKPQTFIFFGIVGSGKGTQANLLKEYLKKNSIAEDVVSSSTGDEYRKIIESDSYTSKLVKTIIEKGALQPDFLTISVFTKVLIDNLKEDSSFISDGFPRTVEQSKAFESAMNFYNRDKINIIYIELSKEEATKRMKLRGRSDDTDEGIAKRFEEYTNNVIPSMEYFENKNGYTIHKINGDKTIEEVHEDIISSINL